MKPSLLVSLVFLFGLTGTAHAQLISSAPPDSSGVFVSAEGGAALYGRFFEVRTSESGEQELRGATAPTFGLGVGYVILNRTTVRLVASYSPTSLELVDDSGSGATADEFDDLADLDLFTVTAEVRRAFRLSDAVQPYGLAGITLGVWSLDSEEGEAAVFLADDDTLLRLGALTGAGVNVVLTPRFSVFAEASIVALGNPFGGEDGFRYAAAEPFDEPATVRATRLQGGLQVRF